MSDKEFIEICNNSATMSRAANKAGLAFTTFKRRAIELGCYRPNQGAKGTNKAESSKKFQLKDILEGKHPQYQSRKLKIRLIKENIFEDKCCKCGWSEKRPKDEFSTCELHHKNGNPKDHRLENLEILCPNCHSLTENFRNVKRID